MSSTPNINAILKASPRSCRYGAPLGAGSWCDGPSTARLYCQRVRMVDGDYAPDGTYWGGGRGTVSLWCAFRADGTARVYVRASTRLEALRQAVDEFPDLAHEVEA